MLEKWGEIRANALKTGKNGLVGIPLDPFSAIFEQENADYLLTNSKEISLRFPQIEYEEDMEDVEFDRVVTLENGGQIVIDKTEAMWVFDVNSYNAMKVCNSINIDETNLLALRKIATILKERCIAGQVIIDFINSSKSKLSQLIEEMQEETKNDSVQQKSISMLPSFVMYLTRKEEFPYL